MKYLLFCFLVIGLMLNSSCLHGDKNESINSNTNRGDDRNLFSEISQIQSFGAPDEPYIKRQNILKTKHENIPRTINGKVTFNLFPNTNLKASTKRVVKRSSSSYTIYGDIDNKKGDFRITVENNAVTGIITTKDQKVYEIDTPNSTTIVKEIDESLLKGCGTTFLQVNQNAPLIKKPGFELFASDSPSIDLLVVYTNTARTAVGNVAAMTAKIHSFVDDTNQFYINSEIDATINLIHAAEVLYRESGSGLTDLQRLTRLNDGFIDEVHALREEHAADLVCLIVNDFDVCGIAWLSPGPSTGFSVVDWHCGSKTFAHELGHNLGCHHDRQNASGQGKFPYSYGWRFTDNTNVLVRTIMSYAPGFRIGYFSNPEVLYNNVPTGVPEGDPEAADNAKTINNTSPIVALFRSRQDDCNHNGISDAIDIINGTSRDCNQNQIPDECDILGGHSLDLNGNLIPDECECDRSKCDDGILCTIDTCDPVTDQCFNVPGTVVYGDLNVDGVLDVDDINIIVSDFSNGNLRSDVFPCGGDGIVDSDDILAVVNAFSGFYACPHPCP